MEIALALIVFGPFFLFFLARPFLIWFFNFFLPPQKTEYERLQGATSKIQKARKQARARSCGF